MRRLSKRAKWRLLTSAAFSLVLSGFSLAQSPTIRDYSKLSAEHGEADEQACLADAEDTASKALQFSKGEVTSENMPSRVSFQGPTIEISFERAATPAGIAPRYTPSAVVMFLFQVSELENAFLNAQNDELGPLQSCEVRLRGNNDIVSSVSRHEVLIENSITAEKWLCQDLLVDELKTRLFKSVVHFEGRLGAALSSDKSKLNLRVDTSVDSSLERITGELDPGALTKSLSLDKLNNALKRVSDLADGENIQVGDPYFATFDSNVAYISIPLSINKVYSPNKLCLLRKAAFDAGFVLKH